MNNFQRHAPALFIHKLTYLISLITQVRSNPLYTSMILAWSMTEVIRYTFYACSILGKSSYVLLYLRYTTFYILYPVGASSEAFLTYASLPTSSPVPGWQSWMQGLWKPTDYVRAVLFAIWWPGNTRLFLFHCLRSSQSFQDCMLCTPT